ncbi:MULTISPECIES: hypothetical protein [unclassified Streptomyces]|uniref:hypothetical protein n=1 Tax=unclassified Streptomyces TaxID=2593676 RepID=UPI000DC26ECC|nr:hypothetical protein [Streptomyces sp. PsTaAH-137]RAJ91394.1 hypothetical protein K377_00159 [Streptomyces sp. PsTaAH-137]
MKRRPALAGLTLALVVTLTACGGGDTGKVTSSSGSGRTGSVTVDQGTPRKAQSTKVTGVRDTERHVTRRTSTATRPHYVKKCETDTHRVKHTRRSKGRTKTWYTTETDRDCHKVRRGTEKYTRVVRRERWCVRLDDVSGAHVTTGKDDVWFRVPHTEYSDVRIADRRAKVTIEPTAQGC